MKNGPLVFLITLQLALVTVPTGQVHTPNVFDAYGRGDLSFLRDVNEPSAFDAFRQNIQQTGQSWISRVPADSSRRRLIVGAVALEVTQASLPRWNDKGRDLVEWACKILRSGDAERPTAGEQAWYLAAVAVMQGAYDSEAVREHLHHTGPRLAAEPRLPIIRAITAELETWPVAKQPAAEDEQEARDRARRAYARGLAPSHRDWTAAKLWDLLSVMEQLTRAPETRSEGHVRLGNVQLRLARNQLALTHFEAAERVTDDAFLLFLARYLRGRALHRTEPAVAVEAYRSALEAVPRAQSASFSLAALLFAQGDRAGAIRIVDAAAQSPIATDPWRTYQQGEYRFWPQLIDRVRAAAR